MEIRNKAALMLFALGVMVSGTVVNAAASAVGAAAVAPVQQPAEHVQGQELQPGEAASGGAALGTRQSRRPVQSSFAPVAGGVDRAALIGACQPDARSQSGDFSDGDDASEAGDSHVEESETSAVSAVAPAAGGVDRAACQSGALDLNIEQSQAPVSAASTVAQAPAAQASAASTEAPAVVAKGAAVASTEAPKAAVDPVASAKAKPANADKTWAKFFEDAKTNPVATAKVTGMALAAVTALFVANTVINYANLEVARGEEKPDFGTFFRDQLTAPFDLDVNSSVKALAALVVVGGIAYAGYTHFTAKPVVAAPAA